MTPGCMSVLAGLVAMAVAACGGSSEPQAPQVTGARESASSGGSGIAFSRADRDERFRNIWLMNADGGQQTRLTEGALTAGAEAFDGGPAWSPDGSHIAFGRTEGKDSDIWIANFDGSDETNLTDSSDTVEGNPAWAPDGERIAFSRYGGGTGIYLMNTNGTEVTRLTAGHNDSQPTWAPSGQRIAFISDRVRAQIYMGDIYAIDADGSDETNLSDGVELRDVSVSSPAFSPDGKRIAFLGTKAGAQSRVVWVMNADGSDPTPLANTLSLSFSRPAWSPDGRRIAFVGEREGFGIYVMAADGTDERRLHHTRFGDREPAWSP